MDEKKKKIKKFDAYNIAIIVCVVLIVISAIVLFLPDKQVIAEKFQNIFSSEEKEITEDEAKEKALKKFKEMGESTITVNSLTIRKIQRSGEEYYYIVSPSNTMEIKIIGGMITRINSKIVE